MFVVVVKGWNISLVYFVLYFDHPSNLINCQIVTLASAISFCTLVNVLHFDRQTLPNYVELIIIFFIYLVFSERRFFCDTCPRKYLNKISLQRHKKYECGKEPQFECQYCHYKTKRKISLKTHQINKHLKEII